MKDQTKKKRSIQELSWLLLVVFCHGLFTPTLAVAGGGGPTQPEVQSFTPIGVSEMVDPFTGDFSYNIPLMDIEGYPINIAYSSGITMDQEASWVGLGWNLNAGAIVRNMRGLPDDFSGDEITKTESRKPQTEVGVNASLNFELFGKTLDKKINENDPSMDTMGVNFPNIKMGIKVAYNNYTGYSTSLDFGPSFSLGKLNNSNAILSADLSVSMSNENGAGFSGGVSLSKKSEAGRLTDARITNSFDGGYNSRAGLTYLAYGLRVRDDVTNKKGAMYNPFTSSYNPGLQSYSPSSSPSYLSNSLTGRVSGTTTVFAADAQWSAGIYYNIQGIDPLNLIRINPAYGYFNLEYGQRNAGALLDFNRDNEMPFTKYTPNLASTFLTNDIFSIQAQGISGSYRAYRDDIGFVFDPVTTSSSTSGNLGIEVGPGSVAEGGVDLTGYMVDSYSGPWRDLSNKAASKVKFEQATGLNENEAFQEATERAVDVDQLFPQELKGGRQEHFLLEGMDMAPKLNAETEYGLVEDNNRTERLKRNQLMYFLTIKDLKDSLGLNAPHEQMYAGAPDHHIGEITQIGTDGRRYVFGVPAYNLVQEDVTFAIGNNMNNDPGPLPAEDYTGIAHLGSDFATAASTSNNFGIDNSYSSQITPAYAHAFMLSAVLSDDYIDSDGEKGPSVNDFGSYVAFDYQKVEQPVKWRSPMPKNSGFHNPGLKTDLTDDKASFVYGEKEVWYVKAIETKNYVAIFEIADRDDGISAAGRSGGLDPSIGRTKCLKKITLYARQDYEDNGNNAVPIQEVHFVYDYSLCQGYPANINGGGKLTLKEIYFTYQGSYKMKRSSYRFDYNAGNAGYNMKAVDRWGNYQATGTGEMDYLSDGSPLNSSDFPYTIQDEENARENAQQWTLTDIHLPSGGKIHVDYESDDYAFVQHLQASQMYAIVATGDVNDDMNAVEDIDEPEMQPLSKDDEENKNRVIFFKLKPGYNKQSDYFVPGEPVYFKCLVNMKDQVAGLDRPFEYVTGYAYVESFEAVNGYGKVKLRAENLSDDKPAIYNPITKAAILFGRSNMQRTIYDVEGMETPGTDENSITSFANSVVNSIGSFKELFTGPNQAIYDRGRCQELVTQHSFIRLLEPTGHKYGGGLRVKSIKMFDNWAKMVNSGDPNIDDDYTYGQNFTYQLEDGRSSGVASYEPMVGGDENTWRKSMSYDEKFMLAPDKEVFLSGPIMESQFPSPSVGYSRVVITDLPRDGVTRTATGKVIKEFYTAKDFPTFTGKTLLMKDNNSTSLKVATSFLPLVPKYDFLTASQGFTIETNDMHGKPKGEAVYAEGQTTPLSTVRYDYQKKDTTFMGVSCYKLTNNTKAIGTDGEMQLAEIGVKYDAVADFRESKTSSLGVGPIEMNANAFLAGPPLLVIPSVWAKVDVSTSQFRSATFNKVVNRFGLLERVTANQDGSIVETNNVAYDAETGEVLLTQTTTNFNDKVYALNFPAHWKYDGLGPAYQNIGYTTEAFPIYSDGFAPIPSASQYFVAGDEVKVQTAAATFKAWVVEVGSSGIYLTDFNGQPITATSCRITIIRSGRRNKQTMSIASITALDNPSEGLVTEVYTNVLNAGAIEFSDVWRTYCDCLPNGVKSTNGYTNGTRGNWRPVRSYTYLTDRVQTAYNNNTNIRKDGVFSGFSPYYYYNANEWRISPANWTFVSEVTDFSPSGLTLETRDALSRYSASLYSFNNTLTTAVAANARQRQIAEGSFEDVDYTNCTDRGVFTSDHTEDVVHGKAHTGRNSIAVAGGTSKSYTTRVPECETTNDCSITVTPVSENVYTVTGTISGVTTNILTPESGSVSYASGTLMVTLNSESPGEYFEAEITFVDKDAGCKVKIRINTVLPDNTQLSMQVLSVGQN